MAQKREWLVEVTPLRYLRQRWKGVVTKQLQK